MVCFCKDEAFIHGSRCHAGPFDDCQLVTSHVRLIDVFAIYLNNLPRRIYTENSFRYRSKLVVCS